MTPSTKPNTNNFWKEKLTASIKNPSRFASARKSILLSNVNLSQVMRSSSECFDTRIQSFRMPTNPETTEISFNVQPLFEEFFIVGPSLTQDLDDKDYSVVEPQNYYVHVQQDLCDKRQVVKDFCFTNGVKVSAIKSIEELSEILYSKNEQQHSHFSFTLNSHEDGGNGNQVTKQFEESPGLNCLCVKFTDILHIGQ